MLEETGMILEFEEMINNINFSFNNDLNENIEYFENIDRGINNCNSMGLLGEDLVVVNIREALFCCVILRVIIEFYSKKGKLLICSEVMDFLEEREIYKEYVKGIVKGEGKRIVKMIVGKIYDLYEKGLSEWE